MAQSDYRRRDQTRVSVVRGQITPSERRLELAENYSTLPSRRRAFLCAGSCLVPFPAGADGRERLPLTQIQRPNVLQRFNRI
jgi:hypothetical protein